MDDKSDLHKLGYVLGAALTGFVLAHIEKLFKKRFPNPVAAKLTLDHIRDYVFAEDDHREQSLEALGALSGAFTASQAMSVLGAANERDARLILDDLVAHGPLRCLDTVPYGARHYVLPTRATLDS